MFRTSQLIALTLMLASRWAAVNAAGLPLGGSVTVTSDYIYRGLSLTCGHPAAQGDLHVRSALGASSTELFLGVWGSTGFESSGCARAREIDLSAGIAWIPTPEQRLTLSYIHYMYPGGSPALFDGQRYDYDELALRWILKDVLELGLELTPDAVRYQSSSVWRDRGALSASITARQPLTSAWGVFAGAGYDTVSDPSGTGYGYFSAGTALRMKRLTFELTYVHASPRAVTLYYSPVAGSRLAASATWHFGPEH